MQIKMQQDTSKTSAATYKWRSLIINLLNGLFCLLLGVEEKQQQPTPSNSQDSYEQLNW